MKLAKKAPLVASFCLLIAGTVAADCLHALAVASEDCERQLLFEELGCKLDATVDYYECVGRSMVG